MQPNILSPVLVLIASTVLAGALACSSTGNTPGGSSSSGGSSGNPSGAQTPPGSPPPGTPPPSTGDGPRDQAIRARCEKGQECGQLGDATVDECISVFASNRDPTEFLACMAEQSCADHGTPSQTLEGVSAAAENCADYVPTPGSGSSSGGGGGLCSSRVCQTGGDCPIECGGACVDKGSGKTCGYGP